MDARLRYWVGVLCEQAAEGKFYGTLSLGFRNGELVTVEKKQTLLPPSAEELDELMREAEAARV